MKRIIALLSALAVSVSLFAGFSFSFGPFDPLYPGADTDPNGMNSGLHYIHQLSSSPEGNNMLVRWKDRNPSDENYFEVIDFREWKDKFNNYIHLQAATDASILRMGFKDIFMLDATIQAGLNTVFAATGGADNLGMDGTFFVGAEAELLNTVAFRFGMRHYSGHVGDEIIMNAMESTNENSFDAVQYTRDNYLEAGIGFRIRDYVKGGVSLMMPKKNSWWDPIFHIPNYHSSGSFIGESFNKKCVRHSSVKNGNSFNAHIDCINTALNFRNHTAVYNTVCKKRVCFRYIH